MLGVFLRKQKSKNKLEMTTAIVILNWNGVHYLEQFLPVLLEKTPANGVEIIVADNASTDNSLIMLANQYPSVRTIILDQNYGFAGGYNKALAQVEADYYVLLNSDVAVSDNWFEPLLKFMNENEDVAACQPKIRSFHKPDYFEHAGAAGGFIDKFGFPFCRGRVFNELEKDMGQYDEIMDVFWASGACLMVRSKLFWKVGGLDDAFFAHMEEIDLCWRFRSRGFRVSCMPQSVVYHIGGGTLNVESPRKTYLNFRNNLLMLYKNLPNKKLRKILAARFWFDYLAALQMFITGKTKNAKSVLKARSDFKQMMYSFEEKRNENLLYSTNTEDNTILQKSLVVYYYLMQEKKYSELIN